MRRVEHQRLQSPSRDAAPHEQVGDAEALAYLMTASLWVPLPPGWLEIYGYLTREVSRRRKRGLPAVLADMIPKALSEAQARELEEVKTQIWKRRGG